MAMKSIVILLTLCFASLIYHVRAQSTSTSISPKNSNFVDDKESVLECWSSLFDLGWCYDDLLRAGQSGKVDFSIAPTCCKAARSMNSGCWPKLFPYNPFFPQVFQSYCLRLPSAPPPPSDARSRTPDFQGPSIASPPTPANTDVQTPNAEGPSTVAPSPVNADVSTPNGERSSMVSATPMNADVPTPNAEGPSMASPTPVYAETPFVLPPYAPSPTIEGPFMDTYAKG